MITGTVLALGLLFGMQHALEADHLAAVATLVARDRDRGRMIRQGVFWGLGHTLTLLAFGGAVMVLGLALSERTVHGLEVAVGAMLVLLGLDLLRRLWRERVHFHVHRHAADGAAASFHHVHAHSHHGAHQSHDRDAHDHVHRPLPMRALLVGMVHGLAGSAALVLLTLQQVGAPGLGLLYVGLFGFGSMLGMGLLSWVVSLPLRWGSGQLTAAHGALRTGVGLVSVGLGVATMAAQWPV